MTISEKLKDLYNLVKYYARGGEVVFPDDRLDEEEFSELKGRESE